MAVFKIRHQVKNELIESFIMEGSESIPENEINILFAGDFWTTVEINSYSDEDDAEIMVFINTFDETYN